MAPRCHAGLPTLRAFHPRDHFTFEHCEDSVQKDYVLLQEKTPATEQTENTSLRYHLKRGPAFKAVALTWLGVASKSPPRYDPITDEEWSVYEDACRTLFEGYKGYYESVSPEMRERLKLPVPDYTVFTNDREFTDQYIRIQYLDKLGVVEHGPYVVRSIEPLPGDVHRVSYYDPVGEVWTLAEVEDRGVLMIQGLKRDQNIRASLKYDPFYECHGPKCSTCGIWWAEHPARQCILYEDDY